MCWIQLWLAQPMSTPTVIVIVIIITMAFETRTNGHSTGEWLLTLVVRGINSHPSLARRPLYLTRGLLPSQEGPLTRVGSMVPEPRSWVTPKKKKKAQSTGSSDTGLYELSLVWLLDVLKAPHIFSFRLALQAVQNTCHPTCKSLPI